MAHFRGGLVRAPDPLAADAFPEIDGSSTAIRALKRDMWSIARDPDVTALLVGESGTGKTMAAQVLAA